jgi:hypothetical protein
VWSRERSPCDRCPRSRARCAAHLAMMSLLTHCSPRTLTTLAFRLCPRPSTLHPPTPHPTHHPILQPLLQPTCTTAPSPPHKHPLSTSARSAATHPPQHQTCPFTFPTFTSQPRRLHQHGSNTSLDEHLLFSSSIGTDAGLAPPESTDSGLGSCGLANASNGSLDQLGAEQPSRTLFVKNVGSTVADDDILALFQVSRGRGEQQGRGRARWAFCRRAVWCSMCAVSWPYSLHLPPTLHHTPPLPPAGPWRGAHAVHRL